MLLDFQDFVYIALIAASINTYVTEDRLLLAQLKKLKFDCFQFRILRPGE